MLEWHPEVEFFLRLLTLVTLPTPINNLIFFPFLSCVCVASIAYCFAASHLLVTPAHYRIERDKGLEVKPAV